MCVIVDVDGVYGWVDGVDGGVDGATYNWVDGWGGGATYNWVDGWLVDVAGFNPDGNTKVDGDGVEAKPKAGAKAEVEDSGWIKLPISRFWDNWAQYEYAVSGDIGPWSIGVAIPEIIPDGVEGGDFSPKVYVLISIGNLLIQSPKLNPSLVFINDPEGVFITPALWVDVVVELDLFKYKYSIITAPKPATI